MRHCVDLKGFPNMLFLCTQNRAAECDSSVIDDDSWVAMLFSNFLGDSGNILGRSDIALIECDIGSLDFLAHKGFVKAGKVNILTNCRSRWIEV
jgi:hypothetical protein